MDNEKPCEAFTSQLNHLCNLARQPGWLPYVRVRAKELDHHESGIWAGLMQAIANQLACTENPIQTKPD